MNSATEVDGLKSAQLGGFRKVLKECLALLGSCRGIFDNQVLHTSARLTDLVCEIQPAASAQLVNPVLPESLQVQLLAVSRL